MMRKRKPKRTRKEIAESETTPEAIPYIPYENSFYYRGYIPKTGNTRIDLPHKTE